MLRVVTTFSKAGFHEYGYNFVETFDRFWPSSVELILYAEWPMAMPQSMCGRTITMRHLDDVEGHREFVDERSPYPLLRGEVERPCWKDKDRRDGYSFKTDVIKFCHKVFAVWDAAHRSPAGPLFWFDADVRWLKNVPLAIVDMLMRDADVSYLGRGQAHSECGFIGFQIPGALELIDTWKEYYVHNKFALEREWHDSFLFDRARERCPDLRYRDLTPGGRAHVWVTSPLGPYGDHQKGTRKTLGYSPEHKARFG